MPPFTDENGDDRLILLEANNLKLSIKDRIIVDVEKVQIQRQDRIGLVGRNGSGKTTLLEILARIKAPDSGRVNARGICELLPQLKRTNTSKSGGEVTQEYINDALSKNPEILLADEPTTNLDTSHIEWLEKKLLRWKGAFVLVSHDRAFLDALVTKIWEINEGQVTEYPGNYSDYLEQKEVARRQHENDYEKYEQKKRQLEVAVHLKEKKADRATKTPKKVNPLEAKKSKPYFAKKQKKLDKAAKALETRLDKLEKVDKLKETAAIKMNLPNEETFTGRIVLRAEKVHGAVGERLLWKPASFNIHGGDKLAVIGPNGSGKTTLVKKIINQEVGITISPAVKLGYFSQNIDILTTEKSILENVSSTSKQTETLIRTVLARLHFFREDVHKLVGVLSGGEKVKVALAKIFVSDINTLILDEPTNFLDIESVEAMESLLKEFVGTVIFVSHDRRLIETVATRILAINNWEVHLFEGTYVEYKQDVPKVDQDDQLLLVETKLADVISRLSISPSAELEVEFRKLVEEKRKWTKS